MGESKEKKQERKEKKIRINKILRPFSVLLLILFLQIILNFDSTCHNFNRDSYVETYAQITEVKTDPYLLIIPMVTLTYDYQGTAYSTDKFFVIQPSFGIPKYEGSQIPVYVNTKAPGHALFKTNFFANMWNWALMVISCCCIYRIIWLIRKRIKNKKKEKRAKKKEEADENIL